MAIVINGSGTVTGLSVGGLPDGTVDAGTLATDSVTAAKIATNSVDSAELIDGAVDDSHMASIKGRKNILINGGFDIWQRGTSFSHTSGKNFICDRWWVNPSSVGGTQTRQSASLDGFNYALRMQRTSGQSGTGLVYLQTEMESADSMQFRGKKVTLSFYAKKGANFSQSNSQITSNVATGTGTDQSLISGFTGGVNVISQNNTLTTSWQKFTHTTSSVLASTVNQIAVQFTHSPAGTAGADDYYYITGVQLEVGDTATDFEHRSYGEELALCQRYYQYNPDHNSVMVSTKTDNGNVYYYGKDWLVPMRAAPTVTIGTNSNNGFGSVSAANVTATSFRYQATSSGNGSAAYMRFLYTADAEL